MSDLPPVELLESTHKFPCVYTMKVIGSTEDRFVERIVESVEFELNSSDRIEFSTRETAGGRHVAVTLELSVIDAEEVLRVYECVRSNDGIVLLW